MERGGRSFPLLISVPTGWWDLKTFGSIPRSNRQGERVGLVARLESKKGCILEMDGAIRDRRGVRASS